MPPKSFKPEKERHFITSKGRALSNEDIGSDIDEDFCELFSAFKRPGERGGGNAPGTSEGNRGGGESSGGAGHAEAGGEEDGDARGASPEVAPSPPSPSPPSPPPPSPPPPSPPRKPQADDGMKDHLNKMAMAAKEQAMNQMQRKAADERANADRLRQDASSKDREISALEGEVRKANREKEEALDEAEDAKAKLRQAREEIARLERLLAQKGDDDGKKGRKGDRRWQDDDGDSEDSEHAGDGCTLSIEIQHRGGSCKTVASREVQDSFTINGKTLAKITPKILHKFLGYKSLELECHDTWVSRTPYFQTKVHDTSHSHDVCSFRCCARA